MDTQTNQPPEFNGQCAFALSTGKKELKKKKAVMLNKTVRNTSSPIQSQSFFGVYYPEERKKAESTWQDQQNN